MSITSGKDVNIIIAVNIFWEENKLWCYYRIEKGFCGCPGGRTRGRQFFREDGMYNNELKALTDALDAPAKALRGDTFEAAVDVEGGKEYDGIRGVCAKIIEVTVAVAGRTAADVAYDNGASGLMAVTVQAAIDELAAGST
jgi:hypothetical protein